jgi:hypothetical protein
LGKLFRLPSYCFPGTFEQAKTLALQEGKYLIVNVIGNDSFPSQMMNRDTWSEESVKETVIALFVFLQVNSDSEAGQKFMGLYHVSPPICVLIDPRTGEALTKLADFIGPVDLIEKLTSFLDNYPLSSAEPFPLNNRSAVPNYDASSTTAEIEPTIDPSLQSTDYETALQTALAASLAKEVVPHRRSDVEEEAMLKAAIAASLESSQQATSTPPILSQQHVSWTPTVDLDECFPDECKGTDGTTRVLLQLADSSTCKKLISLSAPLHALFDFVKQTLPDAQRKPFKLLAGYPPKEIHDDNKITIEQAKLLNDKVTMVWI